MRWVKKIVCVFLGLSMICGSVFADIPDKTVIIGNEAFNLNYANDIENVNKIRAALAKNSGEIIIKTRDTWYDNAGQVYEKVDSLPSVIYTDDNGRVHEYREQNGKEVQGRVLAVGVQDKNNLRIVLNQKPDNEWISNKENFIIGDKSLTDEDQITYNEEGGFIEIKLHEEMKFSDPINVSLKNVTNQYGEVLNEKFQESILVIDSEDKQEELKDFEGAVSILGEDMEISLEDVKGSVYVSGSKVTISNYNSDKGIVISDSAESLDFYKVKCLNVVSFSKSDLKLTESDIDELVTGNADLGEIVAENSKIGEMRIQGDTSIESINASISNIKILSEADIKLKGEFEQVNVLEDASIELLKDSKINTSLNVYSSISFNGADNSYVNEVNLNGDNSKSTLSGNIKTLNIKAAVDVELNDAHIEAVELLSEGSKITADENTIIKTFNENDNEFEGEIVTEEETATIGGGFAGGGIPNSIIKVKSIVLNETELKMELSSEYQLTAEVLPDNAKNKTLKWKSSNANVATVDEKGKVVAKGLGTAVITVKAASGVKAECNITVVDEYIDLKVKEINFIAFNQFELVFDEDILFESSIINLELMINGNTVDKLKLVDAYKNKVYVVIDILRFNDNLEIEIKDERIIKKGDKVSVKYIPEDEHNLIVNDKIVLPFEFEATCEKEFEGLENVTLDIINYEFNGEIDNEKLQIIFYEDIEAEELFHSISAKGGMTVGAFFNGDEYYIIGQNGDMKSYDVIRKDMKFEFNMDEYKIEEYQDSYSIAKEALINNTNNLDYNLITEGYCFKLSEDDTHFILEPLKEGNGKIIIEAQATRKDGSIIEGKTFRDELNVVVDFSKLPIKVDSISMEKEMELELDQSLKLVPKIYPSNATDKTLTWSSSDESIVSVNEDGIITGNALGTAEITVKTSNGKEASCLVTVITEFIDIFIDKVNGKAVIRISDITENEETMILKIMNKENGNLELIQEYELTSDNMEIELELDPGVYNGEINIVNSRRFRINTFNID